MHNQDIYYSSAACGAGKTTWAVHHMGRTPGRYIYAVDRTEEFDRRHSLIAEEAAEAGRFIAIRSLSSKAGNVVSRDFPLMIERSSDEEHVVVIITNGSARQSGCSSALRRKLLGK